MRTALALLLAAAPLAAPALELEAAYGYDHLTGGRSRWQSAGASAAWERDDRARLELGLQGLERFDQRDLQLRAAGGLPLPDAWWLGAELEGSLSHETVPVAAVALLASRPLPLLEGLVASGRARWARYRGATRSDTGLLSLGLEQYGRGWRAALTGYAATVSGAWGASGRLALDWLYGERGRAGIALSGGTEVEVTEARRVAATRVLAAGLAGLHELGPGWALAWELGVQRQGELYTRTGGRLGVRRRF